MYTINIRGKQNPKDTKMVKLEIIFFKTGYARVPKVINITGLLKDWDVKSQSFRVGSAEATTKNKLLFDLRTKYLHVADTWEMEGRNWSPVQLSHCFDEIKAAKPEVKVKSVQQMIDYLEETFKNKKRIKNGQIVDSTTNAKRYVYLKRELQAFTKEKYEEAQNTVKNDMIAFSDLFSDLKGSIIATELDVLNPSSHCILFPTMGEEVSPPEELFLQAMREKLIEAFLPEDTDKEDKEFQNIILEKEDSAKKLVIDIMNNITPHDLKDGTNNYGLEDIIAENHNRVMTKDHYRLHSDLDAAYDREIKLLDEYFSKFKPDDYKDEWQQKIIKYIYKRLTQSVRQDRGLGVGTHPWEEHPARTMLVEESILADKILVGINPEEKWMMNEPYKKAFKDNNITSSTWNYVGCVNDIDAIIKLEIIKNHLSQIEVYTRQDLVLCRYIGGLRQIAQYKILKLMGKEDTVAMDILREMPFCNSSESSAQDS